MPNILLIIVLFVISAGFYFLIGPFLGKQFNEYVIVSFILLITIITALSDLKNIVEKSKELAARNSKNKKWTNNLLLRLQKLLGWIILNIKKVQFLFGVAILLFVIYGVFSLLQNFTSILLIIGLLASLYLLHNSSPYIIGKTNKNPDHHFEYIEIKPGVGNACLYGKYLDLEYGRVKLGDAEYLINQELFFDTREQFRYYYSEDDDTRCVEISPSRPLKNVKSLYFLINSGISIMALANTKIGSIELRFSGDVKDEVDLILGKNIREWAPGNYSERGNTYVNQATDTNYRVVWRGANKEGRYAVIDQLEIPIKDTYKSLALEKIVLKHKGYGIPGNATKAQYMIFAITAEIIDIPQSGQGIK